MRRMAIAIFASFVLASGAVSQDNASASKPPSAPPSQESGTQAPVPPSGQGAVPSVVKVCGAKIPAPCAQVPPRVLESPSPQYPEEARRERKSQGSVVLSMVVGLDGVPRDIRIQHSAGYGFDEEAMKSVRKWLFTPAAMDGKDIAVNISVEVSFHLDAVPSGGQSQPK